MTGTERQCPDGLDAARILVAGRPLPGPGDQLRRVGSATRYVPRTAFTARRAATSTGSHTGENGGA